MLAHSRPIALQHRRCSTPRACWLWGDNKQQQTSPAARPPSSPSPPSSSSTAAALAPQPAGSRVAVQAAAGQQQQQQQPAQVELVVVQPDLQSPAAAVAPPPKPINRTFFEVLRFNGPGPELINGRLAMLAFLAVPKHEIESGTTVLQQAVSSPLWVYAVLLLWVYASMVPLLKGARHEAFGIFTPQAEILNGRAAMLGFGILLALEYKAGVPFF